MIVTTEPKISPSDIMQIIKSISAKEFFRRYLDIKKKIFFSREIMEAKLFSGNCWKCKRKKY
jgi:putative transposase